MRVMRERNASNRALPLLGSLDSSMPIRGPVAFDALLWSQGPITTRANDRYVAFLGATRRKPANHFINPLSLSRGLLTGAPTLKNPVFDFVGGAMREYQCARCECRMCGHNWLDTLQIDREGDPDGSGKYGEWVNCETECPECGSEDVEVDQTRWVSV